VPDNPASRNDAQLRAARAAELSLSASRAVAAHQKAVGSLGATAAGDVGLAKMMGLAGTWDNLSNAEAMLATIGARAPVAPPDVGLMPEMRAAAAAEDTAEAVVALKEVTLQLVRFAENEAKQRSADKAEEDRRWRTTRLLLVLTLLAAVAAIVVAILVAVA
jgi:hypothetical protein